MVGHGLRVRQRRCHPAHPASDRTVPGRTKDRPPSSPSAVYRLQPGRHADQRPRRAARLGIAGRRPGPGPGRGAVRAGLCRLAAGSHRRPGLAPWFIAAGIAVGCVETAEHAAAGRPGSGRAARVGVRAVGGGAELGNSAASAPSPACSGRWSRLGSRSATWSPGWSSRVVGLLSRAPSFGLTFSPCSPADGCSWSPPAATYRHTTYVEGDIWWSPSSAPACSTASAL